jgi:hypothetical protein
MSVLPQWQYSGLKATCQIAFSPPESLHPIWSTTNHSQSTSRCDAFTIIILYLLEWSTLRISWLQPWIVRWWLESSPLLPLCQIDAAVTNLEQDLHRVASWCCENHLLINKGKTKYMMIGTRQLMSRLPTDTSVSFLGKSLKPVDSAKDLGVTLDRHLNYDKHVSLLVSSCMNKLCQINGAKNSFDTKTLSEVISSLVKWFIVLRCGRIRLPPT